MKNYFQKIFFILGKEKRKLPVVLFFYFCSSVLDMIGISLLASYVVLIGSPQTLSQNKLMGIILSIFNISDFTNIKEIAFNIGITLVLCYLIKSIIAYLMQRTTINFAFKNKSKLMAYLMKSYQLMPYQFHLKRNTSVTIEVINQFTELFTSHGLISILNLTSNMIMTTLIVLLLLFNNPPATLSIGILLVSFFLIFDNFFKVKVKKQGQIQSSAFKGILKLTRDGLKGLMVIRVLGKEQHIISALDESAHKFNSAYSTFYTLSILPRYLLELVIVTFIVTLVLINLQLHGETTNLVTTIGLFAASSVKLMPAVIQMMQSLTSIRFSRHAVDSLYDELKLISEYNFDDNLLKRETENKFEQFQNVSFNKIHFHYEDSTLPILNDINLTIQRGQTIGIMGRSGAGKTTMVNVLLGLLKPTSGKILIDGIELNSEADYYAWLNNVAYITQDVFMFEDKLKNNIALGIPESEINLTKLSMAIKKAKLDEVVQNLSHGIDTIIGEDGAKLSGGQRQRVGLARAFYFDRQFLVMDEATAALDSETEKYIVDEIHDLKGEKTLIIIAHRISTLQHCDILYRIDKGSIVACGSFNEIAHG